MSVVIRVKRGTASQWSASTTPLSPGELGFDLTNKLLKIGDGVTLWGSLNSLNQYDISEIAQDAIYDALTNFVGIGNNITVSYNDQDNYIVLDTGPNVVLQTDLSSAITGANEYTDLAISGLTNTVTEDYIPVSALGNPDGVATLDPSGYVPDSQIPSSIARDSEIITSYNDLTDKPAIALGAVQWTANHYQLEGGANTRYLAGDIVWDGGNIYVANYDNESLPTSNTQYWSLIGPGKRLNIDGRDIPNIIWDNILQKPTFFDGSYNSLTNIPSLFSGSYNDLSDKPLLFDGSYLSLTNTPSLFSGSYNDLSDTPTLFDGSYLSLTNLPTLFSGSYNDLLDKPTIPSLTGYATETYVNTAVSNLVDSAPATLNTLNELAAALGDDANYATTISTALGNKLDSTTAASTYLTQTNASSTYAPISSPTFTGTVGGISKSMVGLGNVDNTTDVNKPISTATQTALDTKSNQIVTINAQSSSYTVATSDLDKMVEMSGGGTLTITDSSSFPVGFTCNILQTGSSQVTIAGTGFTPNATPGLKLRTQWSSATLVKRALNSWVVMGDLSA